MNIKIQCCGLVILALCGYFYFHMQKMKSRTQKTFAALWVSSALSNSFDILSIFAIAYADRLPTTLVNLTCKLYLLTLLALCYSGLLYICADTSPSRKRFYRHSLIYAALCVPAAAAMLFLPIHFTNEGFGEVVYTYGPSVTTAYVSFIVLFIIDIGHIVSDRKRFDRRRRAAVIVWMAVWVVAAAVQYLYPSMLIVSFAGALGTLIIFTMIENPVLSLDLETPFFNIIAMRKFLSERYGDAQGFNMISMRFVKEQIAVYQSLKNAYGFVDSGNIYLFFDDEEDFASALFYLQETFETERLYTLHDPFVVGSAEELLLTVSHMHLLDWTIEGNVCPIDGNLIRQLRRYYEAKTMIAQAIGEDRVDIYFQPIYSVKDRDFHSAEVLMRLRDEYDHIIPPDVFIPVAEKDGFIIRLGEIVLKKACAFLRDSDAMKNGLQYAEINLSVVQGEDRNLAGSVLKTLGECGIQPEQINLEITESASTHGKRTLMDTMCTLQAHGISFSLDDFGTGQSNLDYIAAMPVRFVKFDRTMSQAYFRSGKTRIIMDTALKMIHEMGLEVIVEGIETKEQCDAMIALGAEFIQG